MVMKVVAPPRISRRTVVPFSFSRNQRSRRPVMPLPYSVSDEAVDGHVRMGGVDGLDPLEEGELDDGPEADDVALKELDQVDRAHRGRPGCDEVVDDEDALAAGHGVLVHLEVLDRVLVGGDDRGALAGQLALLADDGHAQAQVTGQG